MRGSTEFGVDEAELATLCATAEPHPLLAEIPDSLRPWLLPVGWDLQRLWSIRREPRQIPIAELRWTYRLPWWRGDDQRWFQVTPAEYLAAPQEYPEHDRRTAAADLSYPIHLLVRHGRYVPLDGIHRTVRADQLGQHTIAGIILDLTDLADCLSPA